MVDYSPLKLAVLQKQENSLTHMYLKGRCVMINTNIMKDIIPAHAGFSKNPNESSESSRSKYYDVLKDIQVKANLGSRESWRQDYLKKYGHE